MSLSWVARAAGCLIALAVAGHAPLPGQTAVSAGIGEAADAATGVATGSTFSLGVTTLLGPAGLAVGAGIPTDSGTLWASGATWIDRRDLLAGLGVAASAQGFGYRDPILDATGAALSTDLQGYHDWAAGPVSLRARATARLGLLTGDSGSVRRALWGAGGDATLARGIGVLRLSTDLWLAPEGIYPSLSAAGVVVWERIVARGTVGRWLHPDLAETGWSVGVEVALIEGLALTAYAARPLTDVLFSTPPQRSWSVGLRYGGRSRAADLPVPVVVESGEVVRLELAVDDAAEAGVAGGEAPLAVAGTFSDWQPVPLTRDGDRWVVELRLEAGVHEYAFVAPDGRWFVPEGTPGRKPDGFGGFIGTIVVR